MVGRDIRQQIEEVLDEIRPHIQMDGGDVHFVKFQDGVVYVRLSGACVGCPASTYTLKLGIEESIKQRVSDVVEVVALDIDDED